MTRPDIGFLLNRVTRQVRLKFADALADTGLTPQQAAVLMAIARHRDGRLTPRGIAESIDADAATTSGLLERLGRDGWLVSSPNPDDGRSRLVALSDHAERALPGVMRAAETVSAEVTACLTADEIGCLAGLLGRMCGAPESVGGQPKAGSR